MADNGIFPLIESNRPSIELETCTKWPIKNNNIHILYLNLLNFVKAQNIEHIAFLFQNMNIL